MHRIASRALIVLIFVALLLGGFAFFVVEYAMSAEKWVSSAGSPHVYALAETGTSVVVDRGNTLLLTTEDGRTYSSDLSIREATLHWVGDRYGNIVTPSVKLPENEDYSYNLLTGLYTYNEPTTLTELTISSYVQTVALEALGEHKGTVAVYNYKTGQILCAVSAPTYDPNDPPEQELDGMYVNRFVQGLYTPGSIFKIVTLAAALEEIPDLTERTFSCTGTYTIGGRNITCEGVHGTQNIREAFCNSCNCAFAQVSQLMDGQTLAEYVEKYNVTAKRSFDGLTTPAGSFEAAPDALSVAWSAIGQYTDQVNPCAFMYFMGAIAGNGQAAEPYVVQRVSLDGQVSYVAQTQMGESIMDWQTAQVVQSYMRNNVTVKYGDGNFPGLNVCAKTGTAEHDNKASTAMFAGFVSDEEYPLAFIICVEEGGYGGSTCVPIASKVLAACKLVLDGE